MPQTKIQSLNLQRAITPKIAGIELWFLYTALLHNLTDLTYLCTKFEVTSFNTFEVMPLTRFCDAQTGSEGTDRVTPVYLPPPKLCLQGYNEASCNLL